VEDLLRGHFARLQPVLDLRQQLRETSPMPCNVAAACCLTRPQRVLTCWMTALSLRPTVRSADKLLENLLLFHCRFGEQMMVLDAVINLLRFLDSRLRRLYAAPSELLQGPLDPLGPAFQDPRSFGYPIAGSCTVVSEERILLSVKPTAVAVRMISALIAALPAPLMPASARAMFE